MHTPRLLPPPNLSDLRSAAPTSLFLDFDGTLVEIAPTPDAITVPPNLSPRLQALAQQLNNAVALVTGRGLEDIQNHMDTRGIACAGSHGAERIDPKGELVGSVPLPLDHSTLAQLRAATAEYDPLFEQKRYGVALHFRSAPETGPAIEAAAARIAEAAGLVIKCGKCVVELVRPGSDKGSAIDAFMARDPFQGTRPVFIGDDVTDEDGFAVARRYGGFGIAVGGRPSENAEYKLESVKDVHQWLSL